MDSEFLLWPHKLVKAIQTLVHSTYETVVDLTCKFAYSPLCFRHHHIKMDQGSGFAFTLDDECVDYVFSEEHRLEGMCRVCSSSECELTPIFDEMGHSKGIVDLINNHLPILVSQEDLRAC